MSCSSLFYSLPGCSFVRAIVSALIISNMLRNIVVAVIGILALGSGREQALPGSAKILDLGSISAWITRNRT
jgi:hypothetical protein